MPKELGVWTAEDCAAVQEAEKRAASAHGGH
jgi:hypothetical protein